MAELSQVRDGERQVSGHVVVVDVEDAEVGESSRNLAGERAVEDVVREVQVAETGEIRDLWGDWTGDLVIG